MVEIFAVAKFGAPGIFSPSERFLIQDPLARLIEKYGDVADRFGGLIDPVLLVAGLTIYGVRLATMNQPTQAAQSPAPSPNGSEQSSEPIPQADKTDWFSGIVEQFGTARP